jgi:hypothetical protein
MTGLAGLVPAADLLHEVAGNRTGATQLAIEILKTGEAPTMYESHSGRSCSAPASLIRLGHLTLVVPPS